MKIIGYLIFLISIYLNFLYWQQLKKWDNILILLSKSSYYLCCVENTNKPNICKTKFQKHEQDLWNLLISGSL